MPLARNQGGPRIAVPSWVILGLLAGACAPPGTRLPATNEIDDAPSSLPDGEEALPDAGSQVADPGDQLAGPDASAPLITIPSVAPDPRDPDAEPLGPQVFDALVPLDATSFTDAIPAAPGMLTPDAAAWASPDVSAAGMPDAIVAAGQNLITDPGFETGGKGWFRLMGTGSIAVPGRSGGFGVIETFKSGWWQQTLLGWQPGARLRVAGWGRAPAGHCRIGFKVGRASPDLLEAESEPFDVSWSRRSFDVLIPSDARWVVIYLRNGGAADCSFDDVAVKPIED